MKAYPPPRRRIVQVALPLPLRNTFSYGVPEGIPTPGPGSRVRVRFSNRHLIGYVVEDASASPPPRLNPIEESLDSSPLFPSELLSFMKKVADYYLVPIGIILKGAYPSGLDPSPRSRYHLVEGAVGGAHGRLKTLTDALGVGAIDVRTLRTKLGAATGALLEEALRKEIVMEETVWRSHRRYAGGDRVMLAIPPSEAEGIAAGADTPRSFAKVLKALLAYRNKGFPSVATVAGSVRVPQRVLQEMAERGMVELFDLVSANLPAKPSPHRLTPAQEAAVAAVSKTMEEGKHKTFLLFGVTGSGKTEVYMRLVSKTLEMGKTALYLVPEISLTSLLSRRLIERFGSNVAILHSSMTKHERVRQWRRVASGKAKLVIGPRSALFAPLERLGLMVVDEEHDPSYKQQDFPRYHARDMAVLRGSLLNIPVVLGSATPSIESYYNAAETKKYALLTLRERIGTALLPRVEVVDMREEFKETGARSTFSRALLSALEECMNEGHQAVLLRNRLGFSTFVLCRRCGRSIQCPDCSVAMTFHRRANILKCHYCGKRYPVPVLCPSCGGEFLQFRGEGTEKVEETLEKLLPAAQVARMDREAVHTDAQFNALWRSFEEGRVEIIVGTQMIAKGHDIPNVTLVGVLSADFLLRMPDFRAAERVFQLITQALGRAGRGRFPGRGVIQSFYPEHYAVKAASEQDFESFYSKDIRYRKMMRYPPAAALARIEFRHTNENRVEALSHEAACVLRGAEDRSVRILGPVVPPLQRLEGRFRMHILLRASGRQHLRSLLKVLLDSPIGKHNGREMFVEMDPYVLM